MDGEVHTLSGLSQSGCRQAAYVLRTDDTDEDLGRLFLRTKRIIECFSVMIEQEMTEAKRDLGYWRDLGEAMELDYGVWELALAKYHHRFNPYRLARRLLGSNSDEGHHHTLLILTAEENVFSLSNDFQRLAVLLALVKESSDHLKQVHTEVQTTSRYDMLTTVHAHRPSITDEVQGVGGSKVKAFAEYHIRECLTKLIEAIDTFLPSSRPGVVKPKEAIVMLSPFIPGPDWRQSLPLRSLCRGVEVCIDSLHHQACRLPSLLQWLSIPIQHPFLYPLRPLLLRPESYPLQVVSKAARRPPDRERRWLRDLTLAAVSGYGLVAAWRSWQTGWLQRHATELLHGLQQAIKEQVVDKITMLYQDLQDTVNAESSVTEIEVQEARDKFKENLHKWAATVAESEEGRKWLEDHKRRTDQASNNGPKNFRHMMSAVIARLDEEISNPVGE